MGSGDRVKPIKDSRREGEREEEEEEERRKRKKKPTDDKDLSGGR